MMRAFDRVFFLNIFFGGAWDGIGIRKGRGGGQDWMGVKGRGRKGLLKFHFI